MNSEGITELSFIFTDYFVQKSEYFVAYFSFRNIFFYVQKAKIKLQKNFKKN